MSEAAKAMTDIIQTTTAATGSATVVMGGVTLAGWLESNYIPIVLACMITTSLATAAGVYFGHRIKVQRLEMDREFGRRESDK